MLTLEKPTHAATDLLDEPALIAELDKLADQHGSNEQDLRRNVAKTLKAALAEGRTAAEKQLLKDRQGRRCAERLCFAQDAIIRVLYEFAVKRLYKSQNPSEAEHMAVIATGGYGRGLMAPGSDIDLLFLLPYKQTAWGESVAEAILYCLWDMGLKVGHATRSVDECIRQAKADMTIRTAMLEARFILGDQKLFDELVQRFDKQVVQGTGPEFVTAKLNEREDRHKRVGQSRYLVEPNVKDGKGGLRDLHTLFWIAKYVYRVRDVEELKDKGVFDAEELKLFQRCEDFLWSVRCNMHFLMGRAEERLSFDIQREIAIRLGYTEHPGMKDVERFMKHYFLVAKDVGDLTAILCAALEDQQAKPAPVLSRMMAKLRPRGRQPLRETPDFVDDNARLTIADPDVFARDPINLIRMFRLAQKHEIVLHPDALRAATKSLRLIDNAVRESPEANRLFLEILTSPDAEIILRRMNETGVLGRFVRSFGKIVAMMQFNMYHHYTVDEHLIRAVGNVAAIERGTHKEDHPLTSDIIKRIQSRNVLYCAILLHDMAKGLPGDHSDVGAAIAQSLCPRLGLSSNDTAAVAWLVKNHLVMSDTAQRRDVSDPKTVRDFVELVQSPERLRLLLILTVCDIRAVGPNVWNGWKAALLRQLYAAVERVLSGGTLSGGRAERIKGIQADVADRLSGWSEAEKEEHFARGYAPYWLSFDPDTLARQAELVQRAERDKQPLAIEHRVDSERSVTEVTIYTLDTHGLFARLAGAMAISGANIVDAKIFTLASGMALDTFWIQDLEGKPYDGPQRLARLAARVELALSNRLDVRRELDSQKASWPKRDRVFTVEPRVLIDNNASDTFTVIEVNGRDRPGFLHVVTRALTRCSLQIASAHITTYGERAVDVFYVKDLFGLKIVNQDKLKQVAETVEQSIRDFDARFEPAVKAAE